MVVLREIISFTQLAHSLTLKWKTYPRIIGIRNSKISKSDFLSQEFLHTWISMSIWSPPGHRPGPIHLHLHLASIKEETLSEAKLFYWYSGLYNTTCSGELHQHTSTLDGPSPVSPPIPWHTSDQKIQTFQWNYRSSEMVISFQLANDKNTQYFKI